MTDRGRILVAGGAGYIGSRLSRALLDAGHRVRVVDILLYGGGPVAELLAEPSFEFTSGDLRDASVVVAALEDVDAVVNLCGLVGEPASALNEALTLEVNLASPVMTARLARDAGIERYVFASTCSVYGALGGTLTEETTPAPISLYGWTKLRAEEEILALAADGFTPVALRLATVYGLSPRPRLDSVVNSLTTRAVREGRMTVYGGTQWRPVVHIADAVDAVVAALRAPADAVSGTVFNVGSDEQTYRVGELAELVRKRVPAEVVRVDEPDDGRDYVVSFRRVEEVLGFRARREVADGVDELRRALEDGTIGDHDDPRYHNLRVLRDRAGEIRTRAPWMRDLYGHVPASYPAFAP